ncbi:transposase [Streptomyces sp. TRM 70361]|uniref:transposase n=1 Tax=Streptomyces sp. TRM 70361 TaxID=3116553 RepID=UPI002E7BA342|nr:transposase [Streptomyces sp. TRM 70361]MEE1943132.1 transposase [Streptomyces sp. TRM 70361]
MTSGQWARLEPLLPRGIKPGRPPAWTRRQWVDGIRWRSRTTARPDGLVQAGAVSYRGVVAVAVGPFSRVSRAPIAGAWPGRASGGRCRAGAVPAQRTASSTRA